jgi:hypothetical protein
MNTMTESTMSSRNRNNVDTPDNHGSPLRDRLTERSSTVEPEFDHDEERRAKITLISSADFAAQKYGNEWLIENVLVKGQPAVLGGPRKSLKTNCLVEMAISLAIPQAKPGKLAKGRSKTSKPVKPMSRATGQDLARQLPAPVPVHPKFLGHFVVPERMRVGLLTGESGKATVQETALRICKAKGTTLEDSGVFWGFDLPRLADPKDLEALQELITNHRLEVVILDPLYLMLLAGNTEASASNMYHTGPILNDAARACLEVGATPILAHHARKYRAPNERFEPLELEDLAFAGIAEFARQWILISRRQPYDHDGIHKMWLSVGGSAGFGGLYGLDVSEGLVNKSIRGRTWDVTVRDALNLRQEIAKDAAHRKKLDQEEKLKDACKKVLDYLKAHPGGETAKVLSDALNLNKASVLHPALQALMQQGRVLVCEDLKKGNGQTYTGYRAATDESSDVDDEG